MSAKRGIQAAPRARVLCLVLPGLVIGSPVLADGPAATLDAYLRYAGTASVRHSSEFLYGEQHVLRYRDGQLADRVVLYTCLDGSAFARKSVSYVDPLAPDFLLEDASNGMREGIRSEPGGRVMFFRLHPSDREQSAPLPRVSGMVADAGFDEFVRRHWQQLMDHEALQMSFLVPTEVFRLRLSGLWGWFLRGIDVYYSGTARVLVRNDGLSDLRNVAGDPFSTEIAFAPAARGPGSAQELLAARQAPLHPCR